MSAILLAAFLLVLREVISQARGLNNNGWNILHFLLTLAADIVLLLGFLGWNLLGRVLA